MSIDVVALLLAIPSALILWLLADRDPKRLRVQRIRDRGALSANQRKLLTVALFLPALPLMALGYWSAFLIWFGAVFMVGWCVVLSLSTLASR
ncbi:hypothetical protein FHR99_000308 [Litorivivens lipolytica]|uniref:DUF3325 domain-containing protein n=1 Tax=Litorivivens lipolytica TaxID=1524264 RepID=A0A7W4W274_9GAMM|nr:hypothetical protein [Litorivivens lipolytica]MBB3046072.1 hypothetical protein [Litorivivens lipolytica]